MIEASKTARRVIAGELEAGPIALDDVSIRAIRRGQKQQTARNPSRQNTAAEWLIKPTKVRGAASALSRVDWHHQKTWRIHGNAIAIDSLRITLSHRRKRGDLLWVREAHRITEAAGLEYRSDFTKLPPVPWRAARFLPKARTRTVLRLTHDPYPKVLGDFDADDVFREGCPIPPHDPAGGMSFQDLWTYLHGAWEQCAIVWVHRFEVCE